MSRLSETEIATLRKIVQNRIKGRVALQDDTALISSGTIDSLTLTELILDLETAFSISFDPSQVAPTDFDSVRAIAETVERFR
jgi:acyl carrier protein